MDTFIPPLDKCKTLQPNDWSEWRVADLPVFSTFVIDVHQYSQYVEKEPTCTFIISVSIKTLLLEYSIGNGQLSGVTCSAHEMGRYLANAIVSDKSK